MRIVCIFVFLFLFYCRHRSPSVALKYISSMADFSNKESEIDRLASLDISNDEQEVTSSVDGMTGNGSEKYEDEMNEDEQDEVFLYDDNIPSIPSLPTRSVFCPTPEPITVAN